jgi:biopolymer transport protein ExbD
MKKLSKCLITFTILCSYISINAQTSIDSKSIDNYDFVFMIYIGADSKISLTVQETEESGIIGTTADMSALTNFFTKSRSEKVKINPLVIIKADPTLNFGQFADVVKKIRKLNSNKIKIKISTDLSDPYILIPEEPLKDPNIKPNPLTLVVTINSTRRVFLNNEPLGDLYNPDSVTATLKQIFRERENYGIFRSGTNTIETTVFIKASRSLEFSEVVKISETLKRAGASPVGLQIDELNDAFAN